MALTAEDIRSHTGLAPELRELLCAMAEKLAELETASAG